MKLFSQLRKLGFTHVIKYAFGEIFLIVIGILIAFQLSSWADSKKNRDLEIKTLKDIRKAIASDKRDLELDIYLYKKSIAGCDTVLALLDGKLPYEQKMNKYFSGPNLVVVLVVNSGAYETLKSRGLESITNDSIRYKIVSLYDQNYPGLRAFQNHLTDYVQMVEKNFNPTNFDESYIPLGGKIYGDMIPNSFSALRQNKEYRHYLKTIRNKTTFLLELYYVDLSKKQGRLVDELDVEIKRLEN